MMTRIIPVIACLFTLAIACDGLAENRPADAGPSESGTLVRGNTDFAFDLYSRLAAEDGNVFFSPYSISTALAMTYAGARGNTEKEMSAALKFSLGQGELHAAFADIAWKLKRAQSAGNIQLLVANSLWPQKEYPFLEDYLTLVRKHYDVAITAVDYAREQEEARKLINGWVADKTDDKIRELIKPGVLSEMTRLVLANAIYFKGKWADQFDPGDTEKAPFHVTADRDVEVSMMSRKLECRYASLPSLDIVELPYAGKSMSMIVLLPKKIDGVRELQNELTAKAVKQWLGQLAEQEVAVYLPRFRMTAEFRLDDTLKAMGMVDAFDSKADFSGMDSGLGGLYIGAVLHKAFVEVNEEGTEAAAATAVAVECAASPAEPVIFRADHPFVFLIQERRTGSILFAGRLTDPT